MITTIVPSGVGAPGLVGDAMAPEGAEEGAKVGRDVVGKYDGPEVGRDVVGLKEGPEDGRDVVGLKEGPEDGRTVVGELVEGVGCSVMTGARVGKLVEEVGCSVMTGARVGKLVGEGVLSTLAVAMEGAEVSRTTTALVGSSTSKTSGAARGADVSGKSSKVIALDAEEDDDESLVVTAKTATPVATKSATRQTATRARKAGGYLLQQGVDGGAGCSFVAAVGTMNTPGKGEESSPLEGVRTVLGMGKSS